MRGVSFELLSRGHDVRVYEPGDSWSFENLTREQGIRPVLEFQKVFPALLPRRYHPLTIELEQVLDGADLVLVHEWNDEVLVRKIGEMRNRWGSFRLFFHDTHHRMVSRPRESQRFELSNYDGILSYSEAISERYAKKGWGNRVWTWPEAADTRIFRPRAPVKAEGDVVWVGNQNGSRSEESMREFFFEPIERLNLSANAYGVGSIGQGIRSHGWIANFQVPDVYSRHSMTVHIPDEVSLRDTPGTPSIRIFEALACGIPLISANWSDPEGFFRKGRDFTSVQDGAGMKKAMRDLLYDPDRAKEQLRSGWETILKKHTCVHRVEQLLAIYSQYEQAQAA